MYYMRYTCLYGQTDKNVTRRPICDIHVVKPKLNTTCAISEEGTPEFTPGF